MKINFENDFQQKIMTQAFEEPVLIDSSASVRTWRSLWTQELKSWHSPYKLILDCSNLTYKPDEEASKEVDRMLRFFEGLFLKSVTGFGFNTALGHDKLPFKVHVDFDDAQREAGVRGLRSPGSPSDFRGSIQLQNHFAQHVVELSFADDVVIDTQEQIDVIKSKLTNNLMQWHSKWSLLIDCSRMHFAGDVGPAWKKLEQYCRGFFMKALIGYSPRLEHRDSYPFETYRARHAAVAKLESEGLFMGNDAQCKSKSKGNIP
jgi:hypothetical protein